MTKRRTKTTLPPKKKHLCYLQGIVDLAYAYGDHYLPVACTYYPDSTLGAMIMCDDTLTFPVTKGASKVGKEVSWTWDAVDMTLLVTLDPGTVVHIYVTDGKVTWEAA